MTFPNFRILTFSCLLALPAASTDIPSSDQSTQLMGFTFFVEAMNGYTSTKLNYRFPEDAALANVRGQDWRGKSWAEVIFENHTTKNFTLVPVPELIESYPGITGAYALQYNGRPLMWHTPTQLEALTFLNPRKIIVRKLGSGHYGVEEININTNPNHPILHSLRVTFVEMKG